MKRPVMFLILVAASALIFVLDVSYVIFAIVKLNALISGQEFLSPQFQTFSIITASANLLLAVYAGIYLFLRLVKKKGV